MRLLKVKLMGIRRFEETDALLVADKLVAIVGPNEAGKSSLLEALNQLGRLDQPLPASMATRQCSTKPRIRALFELDDEDRDAVSSVHDAQDLARFWVVRDTDGTRWALERSPTRDLGPRRRLLEGLRSIAGDVAVEAALDDDDHPLTSAGWDAALSAAQSEADSLKVEEREALTTLAEALAVVEEPEQSPEDDESGEGESREGEGTGWQDTREALVEALHNVAEVEADRSPWQQAVQELRQRLPTIVMFQEEDRDLRSEYDLQELGENIPAALLNVEALAELSISGLRAAIEAGDHGTVRLIRETANKRLMDFFEHNYGQSDVCLQLDTDGFLLRLLVRSEGGEDFVELSDRSAGFQWFVALVPFLAQRRYERPLVLIDEIETHLHYAAQADVVDVLMRQSIASQVIYTTHSAGALPPDLGRGVRAVVPVEGRHRSEISNSFWTSGPGFTPLLFGLGAATLAFAIPRFVVIAEGASDAILLPTLLREATSLTELPYRVAPGIANTSPEDLHLLDAEGGRVIYLVDADGPGLGHRANLVAAGVDEARVFKLPGEGSTLEDLVDPAVYVDAINRGSEPFWDGQAMSLKDLPAVGRAKAVDDWCKGRGLPTPSKMRVAQRIVERSWGELARANDNENDQGPPSLALLVDETAESLRHLHHAFLGVLDVLNKGA